MEHTPHEHEAGCACGHDHHDHHDHHHDEHSEACGCGHEHHGHEHGENCGCHAYEGGIEGLSDTEAEMLRVIGRYSCLPVARFALRSSKDDSLDMTAMEPVTIEREDDSIEAVRERGHILLSLEDKGLITLDYDIPITGYDYAGYRESALFIQLEKAAREGGDKPGFLFDLPFMEGGSMTLTEAGEKLLG